MPHCYSHLHGRHGYHSLQGRVQTPRSDRKPPSPRVQHAAWPNVGERGQPSVSGIPVHTCVAGKGPRGFTFKLWRRAGSAWPVCPLPSHPRRPTPASSQLPTPRSYADHTAARRPTVCVSAAPSTTAPAGCDRLPNGRRTARGAAVLLPIVPSGDAVSRDEEHRIAARTPSSARPGPSTPGHGSEGSASTDVGHPGTHTSDTNNHRPPPRSRRRPYHAACLREPLSVGRQ
ncbi:hypothetical protein BU16DRAFT_563042 [Lophium mytilinum]|uniref:Uncharacterized protein n=1 Tax=Lophium mytilinum TaxID=390894 RepID=A0A6A6QT54_9PEZI|nr:hypothetical protein BU16DRAFT_563042 [Lophium mytilinum]